uniref:SF3 helicase domain-containing protein n=1 Tax=viral metagenome TaxID=1070528 RepID=A0A6C0DZ45_9ZZZZ
MRYFAKKASALKHVGNGILCNDNILKYFVLQNYQHFVDLIESSSTPPAFYEFVPEDSPVNLFFDVEIYNSKNPVEFDNCVDVVNNIKNAVTTKLLKYTPRFVVLESHNNLKKSFHIIVHLNDSKTKFQSVKALKPFVSSMFPELTSQKIIDVSVYREGLFRTYLSSKSGENRPLVKCYELSDDFTFLDTFVAYNVDNVELLEGEAGCEVEDAESCDVEVIEPNPQDILIHPKQDSLTTKDLNVIKKFVKKHYNYNAKDIRDIIIDRNFNCIIVALEDRFCINVDREHKSNHQYITIDTISSKRKCHDIDCKDYKHNEVKIEKFPKELNEIILNCLKVNKQEQELIEKAIKQCKEYILENFDEQITDIEFDKQQMVFRGDVSDRLLSRLLKGKCPECNVEHQISDTGYCLKCKECNSIFPKHEIIPVGERYQALNSFWMNYSQLVNNGTVNININNFFNGEEEFSCDVQLDKNIIKDKKILKIINESLDGHKITKMAELMNHLYKDYVYTGNDWYTFDGCKWIMDHKSLDFKRNILQLCGVFNKIKQHYENKKTDDNAMGLLKNIKSLITKLNKPQLKEDILKESQLFYIDNTFFEMLNSKKHLVPFENGVYDLLDNKFRKTKKDDYVNYTVKYDYDDKANNPEVHQFVNNILPNKGVRDYVLKKMSECLNGDIPNTNFLMFIGDGANGKSQLLNLMKLAIGEFGEKVEVTLLTRKRNNANEANTEKIKLMNKRFAFLSEPEDGEKINIGLLKELTGSEEIVARGLYQESVSFVMEAKLFLACNELPDIKGEDTALWRRIRVIDFPSRFVDDPKEDNEYKIDRTLPSRMREDMSWRQTFANMLLEYYYKDVKEPVEVSVKTNEYRDENNPFEAWLDENIIQHTDGILNLKDICQLYLGKTGVPSRTSSKYKKEIERYIKSKYPDLPHLYKDTTLNGDKVRGWVCLKIRNYL